MNLYLTNLDLSGTLQAVEMTKGVKSNTYDSIGNADVNFRRNTTDFFYLRNNTLDVLNTGMSLSTDGATVNEISSKTAIKFSNPKEQDADY